MDLPLFSLTNQQFALDVWQAQQLAAPLGSSPARDFIQKFQQSQEGLLCAIVPFKLSEEAQLFWTVPGDYQLKKEIQLLSPAAEPLSAQANIQTPEPLKADKEYQEESVSHYLKALDQTLELLRADKIQKLVLSRSERYQVPSSPSFKKQLFKTLAAHNPLADTFMVKLPTGSTWIGSSPEVLAQVRAGRFYTHPLAGSLPRSQTPDRAEASRRLLESAKDRIEHAYVVDHIVSALSQLQSLELDLPAGPQITATDSMWHLGTPISARLPQEITSLDLAQLLAPTPAVGGTPREQVLPLIEGLEGRSRSFYAGFLGFMHPNGEGHWSLVLRCAQLEGQQMTAYAGGGIVASSQPQLELAETKAKLSTLLRAAQEAASLV